RRRDKQDGRVEETGSCEVHRAFGLRFVLFQLQGSSRLTNLHLITSYRTFSLSLSQKPVFPDLCRKLCRKLCRFPAIFDKVRDKVSDKDVVFGVRGTSSSYGSSVRGACGVRPACRRFGTRGKREQAPALHTLRAF